MQLQPCRVPALKVIHRLLSRNIIRLGQVGSYQLVPYPEAFALVHKQAVRVLGAVILTENIGIYIATTKFPTTVWMTCALI